MRNAHAVAGVRAAESALMALLPDGALMQRAAAGLAAACAGLLRRAGGVYGSRVVVFAGSGDNGGDALYAGARLAERGAVVTAIAAAERVHQGGAAALLGCGGRLTEAPGRVAEEAIAAADLIIDGLLGIGGRGGLREPAASLAAAAGRARALVVAVDLPSGIDADTGEAAGAAVRADVTVTFGTLKPGLLIDPGASYAGVVELRRHRPGRLSRPARRRGAPGGRHRGLAAPPVTGIGQVPARRAGDRGGQRPVHRRSHAGRRRGHPRRGRDGPAGVVEGPGGRGAAALARGGHHHHGRRAGGRGGHRGSRPGAGLGGRAGHGNGRGRGQPARGGPRDQPPGAGRRRRDHPAGRAPRAAAAPGAHPAHAARWRARPAPRRGPGGRGGPPPASSPPGPPPSSAAPCC